jgi:hypothetical protein
MAKDTNLSRTVELSPQADELAKREVTTKLILDHHTKHETEN